MVGTVIGTRNTNYKWISHQATHSLVNRWQQLIVVSAVEHTEREQWQWSRGCRRRVGVSWKEIQRREEIIYAWGTEKRPWEIASSSKQRSPFLPECPTTLPLSGCLDLEKMGKHRPEVKMSGSHRGEDGKSIQRKGNSCMKANVTPLHHSSGNSFWWSWNEWGV